MKYNRVVILVFVALLGIFLGSIVSAAPSGANVTVGNSSTGVAIAAGSQGAYAGNLTEITLSGDSVTPSWQGYYGNVTGAIKLADSSGNALYNWSVASPSGEVYSSTNSSISWSNIQCLNFTATGAINPTGETAGETNLKGMNLSQLQNQYNIAVNESDNINNTFNYSGAGSHTDFYTGNLLFDGSECQSTRIFDNSGAGVSGKFEEVIQYEPTTNSVVWTSLLNKDALGFDNKTHDFEMLVPEDGHGADTTTTTYYFYVELQ